MYKITYKEKIILGAMGIAAMIMFPIMSFAEAPSGRMSEFYNSTTNTYVNGWSEFANGDGTIGPGGGGQAFDAEYLFYKLEGNKLSIALQTGFDVADGQQEYGVGDIYYTGDLALSFDGAADGKFQYAIDFGLFTADYSGINNPVGNEVGGNTGTAGIDFAGLYSVDENTGWSNGVYSGYSASAPLAMETGVLVGNLIDNIYGIEEPNGVKTSYYRIVSFDINSISEILPGNSFELEAKWTMSCGNDTIQGSFQDVAPVPEPTTMLLLGAGLLGIGGMRRKKEEEV